MKATTITRRNIFVGGSSVGAGALLSAMQLGAQQTGFRFRPAQFGSIHTRMLEQISKEVGSASPTSNAGMSGVADLLLRLQVISEAERTLLRKLIDAILKSKSADQMAEIVQALYEEALKVAGDVVVAIISVARDSIEYARKQLDQHPQVVLIVASDVFGALTGAAAGSTFGPILAAVGALAGAVSYSAGAYITTKKK